jgi:hypothetical protein
MKTDIQLIKRKLFDCARSSIARDYKLKAPANPDELAEQVLQSMDQSACADPLNQQYDNDAIFRAAVRALGSNSRNWATFLANEQQILSRFEVQNVERNPPSCSDLATLLRGQTATADASAILNWAHLLSGHQNYYATAIVAVSNKIQHQFSERQGRNIPSRELFLCVVAYFTDSRPRARAWKWPGMRFALGSEFLRNLHWNGFKPDRHIKRLLDRWTNGQINVQQQVQQLLEAIGRRDRELSESLKWSLTGMEIAPDNYRANFSQFDNLIWLLGAYVEKKGRESNCNYMLGG